MARHSSALIAREQGKRGSSLTSSSASSASAKNGAASNVSAARSGVRLFGARSFWARALPLPLFATLASFAFVAAILAPPTAPSVAAAALPFGERTAAVLAAPQSITVMAAAAQGVDRDTYSITDPVPVAPVVEVAMRESAAPAAGTPDPGSAQAVAYSMLQSMGMGDDQYSCLVALWSRESGWNIYAYNESSGAYGIPQALPGSKMGSAGSDWATSAQTQISWGLSYIQSRYGTPCGAWEHSENNGWY